ncbi:MAG: stalk domain-containing protein [Candidatus Cryosericum sp.]
MKKFLSIFIALAMVLSLFAGSLAPRASAATAGLTDTAKVLTLKYYSGAMPTASAAGTYTELTSQYIYKMGDVIHGTITFTAPVLGRLYTVKLMKTDGVTIVDTVSGYEQAATTPLTVYPFQIGTANVSYDGPFDVVVTDGVDTFTQRVYIQYNLTWKTSTIKNCSGFNTIEGWITRGNGQSVLVPVTVGITYPGNKLAATYVVADMSSGQFSLTFPVDPATQIGDYRVFVRDSYDVLTSPDNDAMIYSTLSNVPAALAITAATYGSPTLLYKNQAGQPIVISVLDNNGAPVIGATITAVATDGITNAVGTAFAPIAPGYYRGTLNTGDYPDVRIQATATLSYYAGLKSNMVIIGLRDLSAFNPYLDINVSQSPWSDLSVGRSVYDTLPCTIGSGLTISVGNYPVPAALSANWYIVPSSVDVTVNGPVREISTTNHYVITGAGKITASISLTAWERVDQTCPQWTRSEAPGAGFTNNPLVMATNACCHTYTKNFDVCEVKSCTTVGVTVDGAAITDASTITVGKTADLVVNVTNPNTVPGLFCGCNTKIVKIYMVDSLGNVVPAAFTAKTWGGSTTNVTELWYNGIVGSVGMTNPDGTVTFKAGSDTTLGINVIDNCEKLTFKDVTFNVVNTGTCTYHLVTEVFGLYRTFDACGTMQTSYPFISETLDDISINPVVTTLTTTPTVYEMGLDPTDILAGVPATIEITDPKFSTTTSSVTWKGVSWAATLGGTKLSTLGITMTTSTTNTGLKFTFSCAFPMAGDLVITGTQYNGDCTVKEVVTFTVKVVMPTFDVKIGLLDGSKIDNDHIITTGFGELIYVTATDPRSDGHHDFSTDTTWTLQAVAVDNACGLPTSVVCGTVPAGCTTPSPIKVYGFDNPHIEDAPQFELYFVVGNCADLLVDTFTLTDSTVKVSPTDVAFTIPASATHLVFGVTDAHTHGAPGVSVQISGTTNSSGASGYSFVAGAATTDKNGEADWAFVPPYSGQYTVGATFSGTPCLTLPCGWTGISASAKITASYKAPEVDTTAPVVKVADGIDGKTFTAAKLALTGKVTDNVAVTQLFVGMNKVDVLPDGTFMTTVMLAEGENTIAVVAYDAAGNKGTQTIKVTYAPAVSTSTTLVLTIGADIVSVNGKATSIDAAPEIVASRTFVPMRFIAEAFGATVDWLPETQGITITLGDHTIGLQIGNATAVIDGNIVSLPAAPYIKNGRTMVPLRVISESFGGDVVWDPAARTITITYQP